MGFLSNRSSMQLHHFFEKSVDNYPNNIALICDNAFISYQELDFRANQLAHYLYQENLTKGSIIGILLDRSIECYLSILAVLKIGAAYVPIEVDYPEERINYIFSDLPFNAVMTSSKQIKEKKLNWPKTLVIDELSKQLALQPTSRLDMANSIPDPVDDLCYVIYTSGSTGKPKGVEITHNSICHYVQVASQLYEMTDSDRVYQGFSLAFDASLEELWMAFANGAALIACTSKEVRSGVGLISFLKQHSVTVFSTVPTLLSTLDGELSELRLLILGGETCSTHLVKKWSKPGLRILNTYGPTEATVIATYFECQADKEVSIGQPLPGYEVLIVDEYLKEVAAGVEGELCIGGAALARGYVNRPESTAEKFIINPVNHHQRLYRTGDLAIRTNNGDIQYAGRIDDQIKLRGFRIELNEIETVIMNYPGVNQAVVSLITPDQSTQPFLAAYLVIDHNSFKDEEFKLFLRDNLPDYMIPAALEVLEAFPLLPSGKVNRKNLPKPKQMKTNAVYQAPRTALEKQIEEVWAQALNNSKISVDADFFYDLGGHSLHAANIISNLRELPALKNISVLDLYKNPSISQLAKKFSGSQTSQANADAPVREKYRAPQWKYILCGIAQLFGCVFQYAVGAWQLIAIILCYSWITSAYSIVSRESQIAFLGLFLSMPLISLAITVAMKWLLLGRVKPGVYPLWGWFYFRWWLMQRLLKNVYLGKYLVGSPLINIYYRLLGASIGKNCHIGSMQVLTHDLLSIGDNTSIGSDSRLNGYIVEDGWLKIGSISIGDNCYLGARTVVGINTQIGDNAVLDDMSMLPDNGVIATGSYCVGSPAVAGTLPADHVTRNKPNAGDSSLTENTVFSILHYLGIVFVMIMYYLCLIPGISLVTYFYDQGHYFITMLLAIPLGAVLFLSLHYICIIVCKKIIMDKIVPGEYPVKSFYYLRHWIIVKMLDCDEVFIMADTLYFPMFLRQLGAKLGRGVEMGETPHIVPDLVTIEEGGFTASSVALAWPCIYGGRIQFAPVTIKKKGFVGNVSLLPAGKSIGEGGLLGCLSTTPAGMKASENNSSWLGSPAVFLPNRELFVGFSDQQTFNPPKKLFRMRLAIEFVRIILPTTFSFIVLFNLLYLLDLMLDEYSWEMAAFVLPFFEFFITIVLVGVLVALKWTMLGKLKSLTKPIWDVFIWKNDIIEYSYNYFINPHLTNKVLGTPFALWIHRCLGTKAGKRVFTDSAEFSEFDLITIGDDVCINAETIIQTHLYEDRIFKVSTVTISSGCNVGVGSIVLYNTLMEKNSCLGSLSLLMKGERLPQNSKWAGIPAQSTALTGIYQAELESRSAEPEVDVVTGVL